MENTAPSQPNPRSKQVPKKIEPKGDKEIYIQWNTGEEWVIPYFELRYYCPCASCVNEYTGVRSVKRENLKPDVRPIHVVPVGRYAIQIQWSDGHSTGMYHFDTLYKMMKKMSERPSI